MKCGFRLLFSRSSGTLAFKIDAESGSSMVSRAALETRSNVPKSKSKSKRVYVEKAIPALVSEFGYTSTKQVPIIERIVVFCHYKVDRRLPVYCEQTMQDIHILTGVEPVETKAVEPVVSRVYQVGDTVGCKADLRENKLLYPFIDRLQNLVPKSRELQGTVTYGVSGTSDDEALDGEKRLEHIDQEFGLKVLLLIGAGTRLEARRLLLLMGLPYQGVLRFRQRYED